MTYVHLADQATRDLLEASDQERLYAVDTDIWIPYGRAQTLLQRFEDLLAKPRQLRPENILVVAPSRNGKSALLDEFLHCHPADDNPGGDSSHVPVLWVENPARPEENRLYIEILRRLNQPFRMNALIPEKEGLTRQALQRVGTKVIVIDELHDALNGSEARITEYLSVLKKVGNLLRIHIIAAGTEGAERLLRKDDQLDNRFQKFPLPLWENDRIFRGFIIARVAYFPLKQPSQLKDVTLQKRLLERGGRVIGGITSVLQSAATYAIKTGKEHIDLEAIDMCGYQETTDYAFKKLRPAINKSSAKGKA